MHGRNSLDFRRCTVLVTYGVALVWLLYSSRAVRGASEEPTKPFSAVSGLVKEARINARAIRVPIIDGNDIFFRELANPNGLSQTRVHPILQDDQGFMWFGTQYGLDRYDGSNYKVFTPDPRRSDSISGAYINSLFKDRSGMLWIGCDQFLDRFDPTTETFAHYRISREPSGTVPATVVSISQDRAGELWLATGSGLYGLNPITGQIAHHYVHSPQDPASLSSNDIRFSGEDRNGRFWVIERSHLEELDRKSGEVTLRVSLPELLGDAVEFYEDHLGTFWVLYVAARGGGGLETLDRNTSTITPFSLYDGESGKTLSIGLVAMLEDKNGDLWFATDGQGLLKYERRRGRIIRYRHRATTVGSIADDRVIALGHDRQGNIWAGFHARVPNLFGIEQPAFSPLLKPDLNPNKFGEYIVNAVYEDPKGIVWVGVTGSLIRIDPTTDKYTHYNPTGLKFEPIAIAGDREGRIWIGTDGRGLFSFNPQTREFHNYVHEPGVPSSLSDNVVEEVFFDHAGRMWLTTLDGLDRFDSLAGRFIEYKRSLRSTTENYFDINEDTDGKMWLGSTSGLEHFDPATGKFTSYQHKLDDPTSLSNNYVTSVHVDRSGTVWAATEYGLAKLNRETGTFRNYSVNEGLPSNEVHCILEDDTGDLWLSTNRGLSRFDASSNTFRNYSVFNGLSGMDFTGWLTCYKSSTGRMFFGGFSGATAFYPDKVVRSNDQAPIVFTDFRLFGRPLKVGPGSPLKKSIGFTDKITLSHDQNAFSLQFAALSYSEPLPTRYRYRLASLDTRWNEAGADQSVNYSGVPPGKYVLRVESLGDYTGGRVSSKVLSIEVLPPWWGSWWFRTICAMALLSGAIGAYSYRTRSIVRQFNLRLEERVSERTRIARELHDTLLQSLHGPMFQFQAVRNMLPGRPEQAIHAIDRAISRTEEAITESRSAIQNLRPENATTGDLADLLNTKAQELFAAQHEAGNPPVFRMIVEGKRRLLAPLIQDQLYRIGHELLRIAFAHANARQIEAEIRYTNRTFQLLIRDDGRGIDPKVLKEGREPGHWGLPGTRERAKQIGAQLDIWSETGAGTEIDIAVPAATAYKIVRDSSRFNLFRKDRRS